MEFPKSEAYTLYLQYLEAYPYADDTAKWNELVTLTFTEYIANENEYGEYADSEYNLKYNGQPLMELYNSKVSYGRNWVVDEV